MMTKRQNLPDNQQSQEMPALISGRKAVDQDKKGGISLVRKDVSDELFQLQLEQFRHDEIYHREISRLTVHHRLNHMALHFAKYTGQLASLWDSPDDETIDQTLTDMFIIGLCSANTLNMRIAELIDESKEKDVCDLIGLGTALAETAGVEEFDHLWLLRTIAVATGRMAKGCESIDHLEPFPFNEHTKESVIEIIKVILTAAALRKINLAKLARTRLAGVKERMIFHGHL